MPMKTPQWISRQTVFRGLFWLTVNLCVACGGAEIDTTDTEAPNVADGNGIGNSDTATKAPPVDESPTMNDPTHNTPSVLLGLDQRHLNNRCIAGPRPSDSTTIRLSTAFTGMNPFRFPVAMKMAPDDASRWYVVEQEGRIMSFANTAAVDSQQVFLDIRALVDSSTNEGGLLAMAFHPRYQENGHVFVFYQTGRSPRYSRLSRFTSLDGGRRLDPGSRVDLLQFRPPYANHFGGELGFDEDGLLYLTIGDGGSGGDPGNRAQNTRNLYGSMIRINVDTGEPYGIPEDNPFAGNPRCNNEAQASGNTDCPEIYAFGLRNAWRWSFDRETGNIWLADVGQDRYEEVNLIEKGGNYGWRIKEADNCFNPRRNCDQTGLIDPVAVITHPDGESITGGFVYRGNAIPSLRGRYVFADYVSGRIWALMDVGDGSRTPELLASPGFNISSFAEDASGELLLLNYSTGRIFKVAPASTSASPVVIPDDLADTGCIDPENPLLPAKSMIPYSVNAPFWSDGAQKSRWISLPDNGRIDINEAGGWVFPRGSVLMKTFEHQGVRIETRLFMLHDDGIWGGYTYAWDADQQSATRVVGGRIKATGGLEWIFPSETECMQCHTAIAGFTLGVSTTQLDGQQTYPSTGRTAHQIETLHHIDALASLPSAEPLVDPFDTRLSVESRARAYLHTNCSQCHRPNGPTDVDMDLRFDTALDDMRICNVAVQNETLGVSNAKRIAAGNSERSILVQRMARRDRHAMPPKSSAAVDTLGVELISEWIRSIPFCP